MSQPAARRVLDLVVTAAICLLAISAPLAVWLTSTGDVRAYFTHAVPPGQTEYVFSKFFGLLAIVLFWFQCMTALAKNTPGMGGLFHLKPKHHALFGSAIFVLVSTHVTLFVVASTLRTKHLALDLLLPNINEGYYRICISLGVVAFWILVLAVFAGWRRLRGIAPWKWVHRFVFAVYLLAFVHGITVGSETRFGVMKYVYAFLGSTLALAVICHLGFAAVRRRRRAAIVAVNETFT